MNPTDIVAAIPFAVATGIVLVSASPYEAVGTLEWSEDRTTTGGAMHGGAIMTLADTIGAVCAFLNLPEGSFTSTTSSSTVFTRGVRKGTVTATARPIHVGRSTIAVVTEVRDGDGKLVAQVTQSQAVLKQG
ncbi:PaaI family thioesterase [Antrihabitans cavernicola]|uniref:PaaI family thioesterase n=1 Tax=Antrihabitans cavernicola TaxID=2495913 RepID=A0A5A7SA20_9NOCA|nr:PaaI family thioesterase [Spelaeibacter cavernicola]KAA0022334.1 PaaI family thioesterase [Spelaeibacter cavernicola]